MRNSQFYPPLEIARGAPKGFPPIYHAFYSSGKVGGKLHHNSDNSIIAVHVDDDDATILFPGLLGLFGLALGILQIFVGYIV